MSVTFDAKATADTVGSTILGTTGVSGTNLTVGVGANRVLVVQLAFSNQAITSVAVSWDNGGTPQALTLIKSANTAGAVGRAELWGLVNPTSGAKTLKVTWNAVNSDVTMEGVAWSSADQTGGVTTFPHSASATGTSTAAAQNTVAVTSATGNAVMDAVCTTGTPSAPTQTSTYIDSTPATMSGCGSRAAGAASVQFNWTVTNAGLPWVAVGTDILAASASTFIPYQRAYLFAPVMAQ